MWVPKPIYEISPSIKGHQRPKRHSFASSCIELSTSLSQKSNFEQENQVFQKALRSCLRCCTFDREGDALLLKVSRFCLGGVVLLLQALRFCHISPTASNLLSFDRVIKQGFSQSNTSKLHLSNPSFHFIISNSWCKLSSLSTFEQTNPNFHHYKPILFPLDPIFPPYTLESLPLSLHHLISHSQVPFPKTILLGYIFLGSHTISL